MKKLIITIVIMFNIALIGTSWCADKYVDPDIGSDSVGWGSQGMPYETIKFALSQVDSTTSNTIYLHAGRDYHNSYSEFSWYENTKYIQILVIKPNITIDKYNSGSIPRVVGDDSYMSGDDHLHDVILIDRSNFTMKNVKVDGYDATINSDSVEVHDAILFTARSDNS